MILVCDNYDSFTYNLVQYLGECGCEVVVARNDAISAADLECAAAEVSGVVISPGPGRPENAGVSLEIIGFFAGRVPVLGVCLGHQCIGQYFGGRVVPAAELLHGKTSTVEHDGAGLFAGVSNPLEAARYHSLALDRRSIPHCLQVTARSADGEIMGVRHKDMPVEGIQFHPEAVLTREGKKIIGNFAHLCGAAGQISKGGSINAKGHQSDCWRRESLRA